MGVVSKMLWLIPLLLGNLVGTAVLVLILMLAVMWFQTVVLPILLYVAAFAVGLYALFVVFKWASESRRLQTRSVILAGAVFILLAGGTLAVMPWLKSATGVKLFSVSPQLMSTQPAGMGFVEGVNSAMPFLWVAAILAMMSFALLLIWRPKKIFGKK
jgi:hypothetical protein